MIRAIKKAFNIIVHFKQNLTCDFCEFKYPYAVNLTQNCKFLFK